MNEAQVAFLVELARTNPQVFARVAAKMKAEIAKTTMIEAAKTFNGPVVRIARGSAQGTHEMQRKKARALPMQYFRQGGGC